MPALRTYAAPFNALDEDLMPTINATSLDYYMDLFILFDTTTTDYRGMTVPYSLIN